LICARSRSEHYRRVSLHLVRSICSRPDCAERAVARAVIEPKERRIIVDRRVDEAGAAILCAQHADRVTVPKGWTLDDRREDNPRLFGIGRFNEPKQTRERLRRIPESIAAAVAQLPLADADPYDLPSGYEEAPTSPVAHPFTAEAHVSATERALARARARALAGGDTVLFRDGDANAPLLTRAFSAARSRIGTASGLAALIPPADEPGPAAAAAAL
jgi:Protein of unknown function (DUF3499)